MCKDDDKNDDKWLICYQEIQKTTDNALHTWGMINNIYSSLVSILVFMYSEGLLALILEKCIGLPDRMLSGEEGLLVLMCVSLL